jgi:plastocyanin
MPEKTRAMQARTLPSLRRTAGTCAALLLSLAAGCTDDRPTSASPPQAAPAAREREPRGGIARKAPARETRPIDPAETGSVRGVVRFAGEAPPRKPLAIAGTAGCRHDTPPLSERVIVTQGRLANVFVYVSAGLEGWTLPAAPEAAVHLDQQGCVYVPHVAGIQVGQTLRVHNGDQATHNVHVRATRNQSFNVSQPPGGADIERTFDRPEVMVPVVCDIHPWMKSFLGVVEHPFFAVSAEDGTFSIAGLPPGEYTLTAWHEAYDRRKVRVTVQAGQEATVELAFP